MAAAPLAPPLTRDTDRAIAGVCHMAQSSAFHLSPHVRYRTMLLATRAVIWPQRAAQATAQPQQHAHKATKASAARRQSDRPAAAAAPRRGAAATPPLGRAWRLAAIRGVDSYDGSFQLDEQQRETLEELLRSEMFCNEASLGAGEGRDLSVPGDCCVSLHQHLDAGCLPASAAC